MNKLTLILQYLLLGAVQGISEMLPISSSGHLRLLKEIFNISNSNLSLEIFLHLASFLALMLFYYPKIKKLIVGSYLYLFRKEKDYKPNFLTIIYLIIATIPAVLIGLLFKDKIENYFVNIKYVGIAFLITSLGLFIAHNINNNQQHLNALKALKIGLFQAIGIIPGVSRSGITLLGAKVNKVEDKEATDFIFLMLLPICLGSFILSIMDIKADLINPSLLIPSFLAFISAFICTIISLKIFYKVIKEKKLIYFSFYCALLGFLVIIL